MWHWVCECDVWCMRRECASVRMNKCKHHMPIARFQALPNHWLNIMISNWLQHILMATRHAICSNRRVCTKIDVAWSALVWCFVNEKPMPKLKITLCMQQQQRLTASQWDGEHYRRAFDGPSCRWWCYSNRSKNTMRMRCRSTEIGL